MEQRHVLAGIVCTLRMPDHAGTTLQSWITWHLHIGFAHIFLFFDDPCDPQAEVARTTGGEQVTVVCCDDAHWTEVARKCSLWGKFGAFVRDEVPARQTLNCEAALVMAREKGLQWLLHIDSDELFFTDAASVRPHFAELSAKDVFHVTYANHEAVPERERVADCFREVSLFKRNHLTLPMGRQTREALAFWEARTSHRQYMLCYDNGKSAVRVVAGVLPRDVHRWHLPHSAMRRVTALADPRHLDVGSVVSWRVPCVLHYAVCGLDWFVSKYRMLGAFPDAWCGGALPIPPCFHTMSRDAVLSGDAAARKLYRAQVMLGEEHAEERDSQLRDGVLWRVTLVQDTLATALPECDVASPVRGAGAQDAMLLPASRSAACGEHNRRRGAEGCAASRGIAALGQQHMTHERAWLLAHIARAYLGSSAAGDAPT